MKTPSVLLVLALAGCSSSIAAPQATPTVAQRDLWASYASIVNADKRPVMQDMADLTACQSGTASCQLAADRAVKNLDAFIRDLGSLTVPGCAMAAHLQLSDALIANRNAQRAVEIALAGSDRTAILDAAKQLSDATAMMGRADSLLQQVNCP